MTNGIEHRCTVVLCDDAIDYLELVSMVLSTEPHLEIVGRAHNGFEGIALCEQLRPDLLVLDVSMPEMDGLTALPKVLLASPKTRVVLLSGFSSDNVKRRAMELGATAFLEKGISPLDLPKELLSYCH